MDESDDTAERADESAVTESDRSSGFDWLGDSIGGDDTSNADATDTDRTEIDGTDTAATDADGTDTAATDADRTDTDATNTDTTEPTATDTDTTDASSTSDGSSVVAMQRERTTRWSAWLAGVVLTVGLGVAYGTPKLAALAVVPLAYVTYGALSTPPDPTTLRVVRTVADERTTPGDPVTVETTITATGGVIPDCRIVDGVPEELAVTDGTPRAGVTLRAGESVTLRYAVTARRGTYGFDPVRVRLRSLAGSAAVSADVTATGDDTLACTPPGATLPVTRPTRRSAGTVSADEGGDGVEFYATREYRRGDPVSRIDWRAYAKRGELVTTTYREERRARAVVVCDVRPVTRRSPVPGSPTGAGLAAYTAEVTVARLRATGHEVSLAVLGLDPDAVSVSVPTAGDAVWLPRAGGVQHGGVDGTTARRTRAVFTAATDAARRRETEPRTLDAAIRPTDADADRAARLAAVVPRNADAMVVSPFADPAPLAVARRLAVRGLSVTALSPDHTATDTLGGRTAGLDRRLRLRRAEAPCASVIDWPADRSLALAVARAVSGSKRGGRSKTGQGSGGSGIGSGSGVGGRSKARQGSGESGVGSGSGVGGRSKTGQGSGESGVGGRSEGGQGGGVRRGRGGGSASGRSADTQEVDTDE